MNQYIITAYDHTDSGALERRMNIRPAHLEGAKLLKEKGNFLFGGAYLDENGKMIGSVMIMQFETDADLETWKQHEPYITRKIWESYEIKPFKVAAVG
jgi:uncharacterized protein YciI